MRVNRTKTYMEDGAQYQLTATIQYADECNNGHNDFTITAELREICLNNRRRWVGGGCLHEEILQRMPELKQFVDLHLSDQDGAPMFAISNGLHWIKKYQEGETGLDTIMRHFRVSETDAKVLAISEDELHLKYLMRSLGLPERWKAEAGAAKQILRYMDPSQEIKEYENPKSQDITLNAEEASLVEQRIAKGYYTDEAREERRLQGRNAVFDKALEKAESERASKIRTAETVYRVRCFIIRKFRQMPDFSKPPEYIYYDHNNQVKFNWYNIRHDALSTAQFDTFMDSLTEDDYAELPEGITFEL